MVIVRKMAKKSHFARSGPFSHILPHIVRVITWRAQKMHSATSSEGSQLVRIVLPCAQARVVIEIHSKMNGVKCRASRGLLSRPPSLEQSKRQSLVFVTPVNSLEVNSMFEQSENVAIAHAHCTNGQS